MPCVCTLLQGIYHCIAQRVPSRFGAEQRHALYYRVDVRGLRCYFCWRICAEIEGIRYGAVEANAVLQKWNQFNLLVFITPESRQSLL